MTIKNSIKRGQGFDATSTWQCHFYEASLNDPDYLEVWCYTDQLSYEPGKTVNFHLSTTAKVISLAIYRDGGEQTLVHQHEVPGEFHETPDDYYEKGCGWPVGHRWQIPDDQPSGFYLVICKVRNEKGEVQEHEAGFFTRPVIGKPTADILLIAATSTWRAYNDWGGTSNYYGHCEQYSMGKSPRLSIHKPWAKGFLYTPKGAPRRAYGYTTHPGTIPRHPAFEFAFARGYSRCYASAGWASYERHFAHWAEQQGYRMDYATQTELHYHPELLNQYPCVVMVGHDEYWSREMRLAIDNYTETGGHFARFGGNFIWQIRLEDEGQTQVCYKDEAADKDPIVAEGKPHLLTSVWEDPTVGWKGAETVGLNGLCGQFAGNGHVAPRHNGGYTVYRPDSWVFKGTDLCYGDQFGSQAKIFGYEVDGLDYTIQYGLPEPTYRDGAITGTQILAMGLAGNLEVDHGHKGSVLVHSSQDIEGIAMCRYGETTPELIDAAGRGNGMIVLCPRGKGQIFNAGSCEWVAGLQRKDADTQIVTRNVLNQFTSKNSRENMCLPVGASLFTRLAEQVLHD